MIRLVLVFYLNCLALITANANQLEIIALSEDVSFTLQLIPSGVFLMGSPDDEQHRSENESPIHEVTINVFHFGTHEVTFAEIDACVDDGGCTHRPTDYDWGRNKQPVVDVSWDDAQEYINWLSEKTGKQYRLPTEAEWEYAARANSRTQYWWGNQLKPGYANCNGCGSQWDDKQPAPVGSFKANKFGLFDMAGNVWEWTQDCWHKDYTNAPIDGRAWLDEDNGNCKQRMIHGGSRDFFQDRLRSAECFSYDHNFRYYNFVGFRVAKDIE